MSNTNSKDLIKDAEKEGVLSKEASSILSVKDIGTAITAALGVPAIDVQSSEVVLVTMLIDDSSSIRAASNMSAVRDGHNTVIESLVESKQNDGILVHNRYLNGTILYPYCPISGAIKMSSSNYDPNGSTPLYDESIVVLGTVLAKTQEFANQGVPVRSITLIVTDGADVSSKSSPNKVKKIVTDMLAQENHIIAAMGISDGSTDFAAVFESMGIPKEWVLTPGNTKSELRKAFKLFSQSAVSVSKSAGNFSQTAAGGFGN